MDKKKIIIICSIIFVVLVVAICFAIAHFSEQDLKDAEKDLQQTIDKYGYVEEEKVDVLVVKFNTEIMDNGLEYPASEEYLTVENETYWYGLYDDISLYIKTTNFSNNKETDVTDMMAIYYDKNSKNAEMAQKYVKYLIKANNDNLTDTDIDYLIEEAQNLSSKNEMANNGKGISVGLAEAQDHYEYQVKRIYK